MIGTGVMTFPWAFHQAGLVLGILITVISCGFSLQTCILSIRIVAPKDDFYDTMGRYWGRFGFYLSVIGTLILAITAATSYFIVMAQMLYPLCIAIS